MLVFYEIKNHKNMHITDLCSNDKIFHRLNLFSLLSYNTSRNILEGKMGYIGGQRSTTIAIHSGYREAFTVHLKTCHWYWINKIDFKWKLFITPLMNKGLTWSVYHIKTGS